MHSCAHGCWQWRSAPHWFVMQWATKTAVPARNLDRFDQGRANLSFFVLLKVYNHLQRNAPSEEDPQICSGAPCHVQYHPSEVESSRSWCFTSISCTVSFLARDAYYTASPMIACHGVRDMTSICISIRS